MHWRLDLCGNSAAFTHERGLLARTRQHPSCPVSQGLTVALLWCFTNTHPSSGEYDLPYAADGNSPPEQLAGALGAFALPYAGCIQHGHGREVSCVCLW